MESLENKVAFITGGSKGIGFGIAEVLLANGMSVAITSRSKESAIKAAKELQIDPSYNVIGLEADVKSLEAQKEAIDETIKVFGRIDLIVANAGVGHFAPIEDLSPEQWNDTIDTNLTGPFYSIKAGLDALKASKGYFISISSLAGTNFFGQGGAYNASKFGLTGFSQAIMLDLRKYGIKVSTIMPGSVATYFNNHTPVEADSWKIQKEDIGKLVLDLMTMNPRTLPSKIEVRPSMPG